MRCEKCASFLDGLELDMFNANGSDSWCNVPVEMADEDAAVVDTEQSWTGYELTEEEMPDCIRCPSCKKFPFESTEIQVYNIVRLVMFRRADNDKD